MFEGLSNLGGLMKQAMQMKQRMAEMQAELERQVHEATVGGGMVTAKVNGRGELIDLKINPEVFKSGDAEMLEELVKTAIGSASRTAQESAKQALSQITGGMNIPGMEGLLGG